MAEQIPLDLDRFRRNLLALESQLREPRVERGEDSPTPTMVIVSKYLVPADARRLRAEGYGPLGENRAAELCEKTNPGEDPDGWHFIGHLQRNKITRVIPRISLLHSLDSARLAEAIDGWVDGHATRPCRCLVQVNVSAEPQKGGLTPSDARRVIPEWADRLRNLRLEGLMTMAPLIDAEACRLHFRLLRELRDEIRESLPDEHAGRFAELSMGMSHDFLQAVEEGATLLRIGRRLLE